MGLRGSWLATSGSRADHVHRQGKPMKSRTGALNRLDLHPRTGTAMADLAGVVGQRGIEKADTLISRDRCTVTNTGGCSWRSQARHPLRVEPVQLRGAGW